MSWFELKKRRYLLNFIHHQADRKETVGLLIPVKLAFLFDNKRFNGWSSDMSIVGKINSLEILKKPSDSILDIIRLDSRRPLSFLDELFNRADSSWTG